MYHEDPHQWLVSHGIHEDLHQWLVLQGIHANTMEVCMESTHVAYRGHLLSNHRKTSNRASSLSRRRCLTELDMLRR